jgi:cell division protein FtsL
MADETQAERAPRGPDDPRDKRRYHEDWDKDPQPSPDDPRDVRRMRDGRDEQAARDPRDKKRDGPTHGAVTLFIISLVATILLVAGGVWYSVYHARSNQTAIAANEQTIAADKANQDQRWCIILKLLLTSPVPPVPGPHATPLQIRSYKLYGDFKLLEQAYHCS